jgi:hypothetical protein
VIPWNLFNERDCFPQSLQANTLNMALKWFLLTFWKAFTAKFKIYICSMLLILSGQIFPFGNDLEHCFLNYSSFQTKNLKLLFQVEVFWVVTPSTVAVGHQCFGGPCCLQFQGEVPDDHSLQET